MCPNIHPLTPQFFSRDSSHKDGFRSHCKTCEKRRAKAYRDTHQEQCQITSKAYRDAHKEEIAAKVSARQKQSETYKTYQKRYHQEHIDEIHRVQKEQYEANKAFLQERQRAYGKTEQGRIVSRAHKHRRKAQKRMSEGSYTSQQLKEQLLRQKSRCYYCKKKLTQNWHADHVVPLSKGGSNTIENIVIACEPCNLHKSSKLPHEWLENGRLF